MKGHNLRVEKVATAERLPNCSEAVDLPIEFNWQTVPQA